MNEEYFVYYFEISIFLVVCSDLAADCAFNNSLNSVLINWICNICDFKNDIIQHKQIFLLEFSSNPQLYLYIEFFITLNINC